MPLSLKSPMGYLPPEKRSHVSDDPIFPVLALEAIMGEFVCAGNISPKPGSLRNRYQAQSNPAFNPEP